jgi:hypothetical protein
VDQRTALPLMQLCATLEGCAAVGAVVVITHCMPGQTQ